MTSILDINSEIPQRQELLGQLNEFVNWVRDLPGYDQDNFNSVKFLCNNSELIPQWDQKLSVIIENLIKHSQECTLPTDDLFLEAKTYSMQGNNLDDLSSVNFSFLLMRYLVINEVLLFVGDLHKLSMFETEKIFKEYSKKYSVYIMDCERRSEVWKLAGASKKCGPPKIIKKAKNGNKRKTLKTLNKRRKCKRLN